MNRVTTLDQLVALANELDRLGFSKEATEVDQALNVPTQDFLARANKAVAGVLADISKDFAGLQPKLQNGMSYSQAAKYIKTRAEKAVNLLLTLEQIRTKQDVD